MKRVVVARYCLSRACLAVKRAASPHRNRVAQVPTSDRITFLSERDDGNREIYSMSPDGSAQTNLSHSAANETTHELVTRRIENRFPAAVRFQSLCDERQMAPASPAYQQRLFLRSHNKPVVVS